MCIPCNAESVAVQRTSQLAYLWLIEELPDLASRVSKRIGSPKYSTNRRINFLLQKISSAWRLFGRKL